jgi:hypothetical protein
MLSRIRSLKKWKHKKRLIFNNTTLNSDVEKLKLLESYFDEIQSLFKVNIK